MNVEEIRDYCLDKNDVEESFPFGETVLVFKTNNKIFCLLALDEQPTTINLKCNPEKAEELRTAYPAVIPGYHMNKKHWNTIIINGSISNKMLKEMIDHSYDLVSPKRKSK